MEKHIIDATNGRLGRIASKTAVLLMGKNVSGYARNKVTPTRVEIINAGKLDIDLNKMSQKIYTRFSGFAGGIKFEEMDKLIARKGKREIIRLAVYGMIPHNTLRSRMMRNLKITE